MSDSITLSKDKIIECIRLIEAILALNISIGLIQNFKNNSVTTFKINNVNTNINSAILNSNRQISLAMTRGYADVKRVCRCINNAVYISGNFKGYKVLTTIFTELYNFISNLDLYYDQISFDLDFFDLCSRICGSYIGYNSKKQQCKYRITFGIGQKLINMTLKYLYVEHRSNPKLRLLPNNKIEDFLHCPIDSYILRKLRLVDPSYFNMISFNNSTVYFRGKPWSQLSKYDYICFLRVLRAKLLPYIKQLEVDFYLWSNSPNNLSPAVVNHFGINNNHPSALIGLVFNQNSVPPTCWGIPNFRPAI